MWFWVLWYNGSSNISHGNVFVNLVMNTIITEYHGSSLINLILCQNFLFSWIYTFAVTICFVSNVCVCVCSLAFFLSALLPNNRWCLHVLPVLSSSISSQHVVQHAAGPLKIYFTIFSSLILEGRLWKFGHCWKLVITNTHLFSQQHVKGPNL